MSNIIDKIQLSGVTYDLQGGGKAIVGGRGISVTTGETADTVSFNLPISAGTGTDSIREGETTTASGDYSHAEGMSTIASGSYSHAEGMASVTYGMSSHAEGFSTETRNKFEHASGRYNVSSSATTEFGDSGNTLFSVGNGTSTSDRKNALEVRQNGDIYVQSGSSTVKLQDYLGGSVTIDPTLDSGSSNPVANSAITNGINSRILNIVKSDQNWAGQGITSIDKTFNNSSYTAAIFVASINQKPILGSSDYNSPQKFSLVETSAITTSITSGSTDSQVPSAKAVYNALGSASGGITSGEVQTMIDSSISGKVDSSSLATVATSGSYNDLTNKPTIPTVPTSNTAFTNDAGYITSNDITGKTDTSAFTAHTASTVHMSNTEKANLDSLATNIAAISGITSTKVGNWDTASTNSHTHSNKTVLDGITSTKVSNWDGAATNASNAITALGGLSLVKLTQSAYDALTTKDSNTLYVIVN